MYLKEKQILYHGTGQEHTVIDLSLGREFKDFGRGYYLTSYFKQAFLWAMKKAKDDTCWIYKYEVETIPSTLTVLELLQYDTKWLDFIVANRIHGVDHAYDIIYNRMADNQFPVLTNLIQQYANHMVKAQFVLDNIAFKYENRNQFCFKTEAAISILKRTGAFRYVREDETQKFKLDE